MQDRSEFLNVLYQEEHGAFSLISVDIQPEVLQPPQEGVDVYWLVYLVDWLH